MWWWWYHEDHYESAPLDNINTTLKLFNVFNLINLNLFILFNLNNFNLFILFNLLFVLLPPPAKRLVTTVGAKRSSMLNAWVKMLGGNVWLFNQHLEPSHGDQSAGQLELLVLVCVC